MNKLTSKPVKGKKVQIKIICPVEGRESVEKRAIKEISETTSSAMIFAL